MRFYFFGTGYFSVFLFVNIINQVGFNINNIYSFTPAMKMRLSALVWILLHIFYIFLAPSTARLVLSFCPLARPFHVGAHPYR